MALNKRIKKRKKALEVIEELSNSTHVLIIHYSCESFYNTPDARTPRITSIAVRYFKTGQTRIFSIHKVAERIKAPFNMIEEQYDSLERAMLDEFFTFVSEHRTYSWIHWNMRDINYGFEAIEHRFSVLGGRPEIIEDNNKVDLARLLVDAYGLRYIGHPRLEKLVEKNGITKKDFLTGQQEADAFKNKEYVKLHQSTLRKVDIVHTIAEKFADGTLKTNAKFRDIYGITPQGVFYAVKDNWMFWIISLLLGGVIGAIVSKFLQ